MMEVVQLLLLDNGNTAVAFCETVAVAIGLNCYLMLQRVLCNRALQSGRLKNNEPTSQLDVN